MRACLFEDQAVAGLEPLTLTRPAFELLCGMSSLGAKQLGHFGASEVGALIRPQLASLFRLQQPGFHTNDLPWLRAEQTILVNSRWRPPPSLTDGLDTPGVAVIGGEVAYAVVGADQLAACSPNTLDDCLESWKSTLPRREAGGRLVHHLWDLVQLNSEQIGIDYRQRMAIRPPSQGNGRVAQVGPPDLLFIDPAASVEPNVVVDTTRGPVTVDRDAVIAAFSRLEGPCYVGPNTQVLGARVRGGTTLGTGCRVGGEVEASIIQGNSNKYHDGFLGHSYVGEWVNFGAGTQSSDLRHDYGAVFVTVQGQPLATGLTKVGCFVGDHTKTGIGTLLNTGSSIGVFCHLLPAGRLLPRHFPSFTRWWNGALVENGEVPALLQTAGQVLRRRGCTFTEAHAAYFRALFVQTSAERRRALLSLERQGLRRSA
jgi:UDP-N-acetylglucosamine diphosphorylase/glucosamine-1-phosphate N-acetyltransferase